MDVYQKLDGLIENIDSVSDAGAFLDELSKTMHSLGELENLRSEDLVSAIGGVIEGVPEFRDQLSVLELKRICRIVFFALQYE